MAATFAFMAASPPQHQSSNRPLQDFQASLPFHGARSEIMRVGSLNMKTDGGELWNPASMLLESDRCVKLDSVVAKPLFNAQDPSSMLFSSVLSEHCTRREKILQMLGSEPSESEEGGLNTALLSELIGLQVLKLDPQQEFTPFIYPNNELYAQKSSREFVEELLNSSRITLHPDGQVLFNEAGSDVKDLLSRVAEFYLPKASTIGERQAMLVPQCSWLGNSGVGVLDISSLKLQATALAPLKSPRKLKTKLPKKKKTGKKGVQERDLYKKNYFHACETLLSLFANDRKHVKMSILALKKSGPELPELVNAFSAGIAGTALAVLFSVVSKLAVSAVPFCSSNLSSAGLGFGLIWLSCAVNELRDITVYTSKRFAKLGMKEEEVMNKVGKIVKAIYFRALAVIVVTVLTFA